MFFEVNKIEDVIRCRKCSEKLDEPRILPCGDAVCSHCVLAIHVSNTQFECILCERKHVMPTEGLPLSKNLIDLISLRPTEVYRSKSVEELKDLLNEIQKKIISLVSCINNGVDKIKEKCIELRNQVQLATEQTIEQINEHCDQFIKEIDQFEKDTVKSYQLNENIKIEAIKKVKELETFHSGWTDYLQKSIINDQDILNAKLDASKLNEKAEEEKVNLESFIFNQGLLKFTKNTNKIEKTSLGCLEFDTLKGTKSSILSDKQFTELMQLCEFSLDQKWKLLYRASRDGYSGAQFHSKCDKKPNTLALIKSNNGNVFGGYTQQEWSHPTYGYKTDPNAFIFSFINNDNKPIVMQCKKPKQAIYCSYVCGVTFGGGNDIYICDNSNEGVCTTNLGHSYKHPDKDFQTKEAKSFLAGSSNFQTVDIEVYSKE